MSKTKTYTSYMEGGLVDNGVVEIVADTTEKTRIKLLFWNGQTANIQPRFELEKETADGVVLRLFEPKPIDHPLLENVNFPTGVEPYGDTETLFAELCTQLEKFTGLPENLLELVAFFVIGTWFSESSEFPITLNLVGPLSGNGYQLLQLLGALGRRVMPLGEANLRDLYYPSQHPKPILAIENYDSSWKKVVQATNCSTSHLLKNGVLFQMPYHKIIRSTHSLSGVIEGLHLLEIPVSECHASVSLLDAATRQGIAKQFQNKLLLYRVTHLKTVLESKFDAPQFPLSVRYLARFLGKCLPDAQPLQEKLFALLGEYGEDVAAEGTSPVEAALVEIMLDKCHEDGREQIQVGELTEALNTKLEQSGEILTLEPRAVGHCLRTLGLPTKRLGSAGRGLLLLKGIRTKIHMLAAEFGELVSGLGCETCAFCKACAAPPEGIPE